MHKPSTSITHVSCESKLHSVVRSGTCGGIHTHENGCQPGVPTRLVQELNASTVMKVTKVSSESHRLAGEQSINKQ